MDYRPKRLTDSIEAAIRDRGTEVKDLGYNEMERAVSARFLLRRISKRARPFG